MLCNSTPRLRRYFKRLKVRGRSVLRDALKPTQVYVPAYFCRKVSTEKFFLFAGNTEQSFEVEFNRFEDQATRFNFSLYLFFNGSGVWTQRSHGERQPSPPGKHALALRVHSSMIPKRGNLTFFVLLTIHHPPPPLSFIYTPFPTSIQRQGKQKARQLVSTVNVQPETTLPPDVPGTVHGVLVLTVGQLVRAAQASIPPLLDTNVCPLSLFLALSRDIYFYPHRTAALSRLLQLEGVLHTALQLAMHFRILLLLFECSQYIEQ